MELVSDGGAVGAVSTARRRPDEAAERFGGAGYRAPSFVDEEPEVDRLRRLSRLVAVGATDVRIHLERVNTWVELGDPDGAFGSLLDLFIATGTGAKEVKRRCMFWAGDVLEPSQRTFLEDNLETGIRRSTPTPHAPHSVLASGITGSVRLVEARTLHRGSDDSRCAPSELPDAGRPSGDVGPAPLPRREVGGRAMVPRRPERADAPETIRDIARFDPGSTLIEVVKRAAATLPENSPGVEVTGRFGRLVVDRVHMAMSIDHPELLPSDIADLDLELRTPRGHMEDDESAPYGVALWRLVLAVSDGRLPTDLDLDRPHRLRRWPDLSRVDRIEGDTKMSALLQRSPMTVAQLAEEIGSPASAASFATATWLTGLLDPAAAGTGGAVGRGTTVGPGAEDAPAADGPGASDRWGALRSLARWFKKGRA